jgi:hypothetical protein
MKKSLTTGFVLSGVLGLISMGTASASVVGGLQLNGGSATVTATSLTWNGFAVVNAASTLTYGASHTLVPTGTDVTLANLPGTLPIPIDDFMTFMGIPTLDFVLDLAGPGSSNTDCSVAGLAAHGGQCSAFAGAPITLSQGVNGTVASLGVSGIAKDGTSPDASWFGEFSQTITQLTGSSGVITPAEIQAFFGGPSSPNSNAITSTFSGTFVANIVPEPSTIGMTLMGGGLILVALARRRRLS